MTLARLGLKFKVMVKVKGYGSVRRAWDRVED